MFIAVLSILFAAPAASAAADPFAGLAVSSAPATAPEGGSFGENFGFRRELMSEFVAERGERASSRQSAGFEALKKFSTETATWAGVDVQGRLVRRDRFVPTPNDMEGMSRPGWFFEYHNVYADFYDVLNPVLGDEARGAALGRFNIRAGRFYVPFGLNTQTDTHGTLLQLSNERDFGFERDWYAGLRGSASRDLDYGAYYLVGSGYDLKSRGQSGLAAARLSLSNRFLSDYGLEGGLSWLGGERLAPGVVKTSRAGGDVRLRRPVPGGTVAWTTELSGGRDAADAVFGQLHQLDYLAASRRWGVSAQYRRYWRAGPADASLIGEGRWYFRNDVASSNLEWLALAVETRMENTTGRRDAVLTLQYYRYW